MQLQTLWACLLAAQHTCPASESPNHIFNLTRIDASIQYQPCKGHPCRGPCTQHGVLGQRLSSGGVNQGASTHKPHQECGHAASCARSGSALLATTIHPAALWRVQACVCGVSGGCQGPHTQPPGLQGLLCCEGWALHASQQAACVQSSSAPCVCVAVQACTGAARLQQTRTQHGAWPVCNAAQGTPHTARQPLQAQPKDSPLQPTFQCTRDNALATKNDSTQSGDSTRVLSQNAIIP